VVNKADSHRPQEPIVSGKGQSNKQETSQSHNIEQKRQPSAASLALARLRSGGQQFEASQRNSL
jgi:hypothetical protein